MKERFEELIHLSRIATECDPWVRQTGMTGYCRELKGEVDEVLQAIDNNDMANLREELGDLFLDLARLCALAEEQGHFNVEEILEGVLDKVKRRQPFLLEKRRVEMAEALRYWNTAKAKERSSHSSSESTGPAKAGAE